MKWFFFLINWFNGQLDWFSKLNLCHQILGVGIEDVPIIEDNNIEIGQEMWQERMNEKSEEDRFSAYL